MNTTRIYGEAQLARALDNNALNIVLYEQYDCMKSKMINDYLESLANDGHYDDINVMIINSQRLPKEYFQRRGVVNFPVVAYCQGKREINRVTGYHDLEMLVRGIAASREKLSA